MKNKHLSEIDLSRGAIKRPFNGFVDITLQEARKELSILRSHERAYIFLANGKVRRIDGNEKKVWMDWRLNYEGAYMIHNHTWLYDTSLSFYDLREARELKLAATEVVCGDNGQIFILEGTE